VCQTGQPINLYFDDLENTASGNWTLQTGSRANRWFYPQNPNPYFDATYATSGTTNIWGYDQPAAAEFSIAMTGSVAVPAGSEAYLRFNHAYGFEDGDVAYDGGVLEYSTDAGASYADAGALLVDGGYNGTIANGHGNPLSGRRAFVRENNGYRSTRADLSSLGGQSIRFRGRIGTDTGVGDYGWFVDDVRIYTCGPPPADTDGDGVTDADDNCRSVANADQANLDVDGQGGACDPDDDNDGITDTGDNCRSVANPDQADLDVDGQGDACDPDDDNDGITDTIDDCRDRAAATTDGCPAVTGAGGGTAGGSGDTGGGSGTPAGDTLQSVRVHSCRRTGRSRRASVVCTNPLRGGPPRERPHHPPRPDLCK
jgi:hypothetical protein